MPKQLILQDQRYLRATTPATLGRYLQENLSAAQLLLEPLLISATCIQKSPLPLNSRVGTLLCVTASGTPVMADAGQLIVATDVVCQLITPTYGIIAPTAILKVSLTGITGRDFVPLYLGDGGVMTAIRPETGFVQQVANVRRYLQRENLYEVYFFSGVTAFSS